MTKINTKYHGVLEIKEDKLIYFPKGIPGFPDEHDFLLVPLPDNDSFQILQSAKTSDIAFVVVNPFFFFNDYDFSIEDTVIELLKIDDEKDVIVLSILTVQDPFEQTTANLQAPIIINMNKRLGKQVILNNTNYRTKHELFNHSPSKVEKG